MQMHYFNVAAEHSLKSAPACETQSLYRFPACPLSPCAHCPTWMQERPGFFVSFAPDQEHWSDILCRPRAPMKHMREVHLFLALSRQVEATEGYLGLLEELELDAGLVDGNLCFFWIDIAEQI